jgi:hypothetical protein
MAASSPPPESPPPPGTARRRPWYLTLALTVAWLTGAFTVVAGVNRLSWSHVPPYEFDLLVDAQSDITSEERARQKAAFEAYVTALHAADRRVAPLCIAEVLVGAAIVVFAQRAANGRPWARQALIQLTAAHIGLSAIEWGLMPDVRTPESEFSLAIGNVDTRDVRIEEINGVALVMSLTLGALTVAGLSARRSRAFYEVSSS